MCGDGPCKDTKQHVPPTGNKLSKQRKEAQTPAIVTKLSTYSLIFPSINTSASFY